MTQEKRTQGVQVRINRENLRIVILGALAGVVLAGIVLAALWSWGPTESESLFRAMQLEAIEE